MGDRLTKQASDTPYGDIFDKLLPEYIAMGMTYDEFWDGEYGMKTAYRSAYITRIENERLIADQNNWYMGQYIISVLNAVPLLVAGLNVKKGANLPKYPEKPLLYQAEEQKKEEARQKQQEDQAQLALAMFQAFATKFNKNFEQKEQQQSEVVQGQ